MFETVETALKAICQQSDRRFVVAKGLAAPAQGADHG
jgi:hypothetical protein